MQDIKLQGESIITVELLEIIREQYRLNWYGTHGVIHWNRVFDNGVKLAEQRGVNLKVVQLFSVFHDSCRMNENQDVNHGKRGAELAKQLRKYCPLNDAEFSLLTIACELHTIALNYENITIQACFDADRLDLGRVGIYPDQERLCTPMAKDKQVIEWAFEQSIYQDQLPENPFGLQKYKDQ